MEENSVGKGDRHAGVVGEGFCNFRQGEKSFTWGQKAKRYMVLYSGMP